jgi:putative FmdB family regulatory protein
MPTYVYECAKCGDEFELYQSFSEDPLKKHPGCGGKVAKVFQPVGIVLKGSGFYKNDSRSGAKRGKGGAEGAKPEKADKSEKSDTTKSDNGSKSGSSSGSGSGDAKSSKRDSKPSTPASSST